MTATPAPTAPAGAPPGAGGPGAVRELRFPSGGATCAATHRGEPRQVVRVRDQHAGGRLPDWPRAIAARSALRLSAYRPGRQARRIARRLLVVVGEQDALRGHLLEGPPAR